MLIDENIFSATKKIHHKKPTSQKITLQVNKSITKFDGLCFKLLETWKTNAQATVKFIIAEAAAFCFCRCGGLH